MNAYDLPSNLRDFALIPNYETVVATLAGLSEQEDWGYKNTPSHTPNPVLENYVKYTYGRIAEEKKVAITGDEQFACWNTGLISPNQEPIYILFEENRLDDRRSYWHFWRFARRGQWELSRFDVLPEMAHYFDDPSVLVYDTRKELRANIEHIIADNKDRFPDHLQNMGEYALQNMVKGAIDSVKERVKRNYKTAIPQYYNGVIQLLLPLSLTDPSKADLALVVDRFPEFYRAATCLTLDMAYNNARQLARPDRDWLKP